MVILITVGILLLTSIIVLALRIFFPAFRSTWLVATSGGILSFASVFAWLIYPSAQLQFSIWQPISLFKQSPAFLADGIAWAFALSAVSLALAIILTAVARSNFPSPLAWSGILALSSLGVLAVTADNPLTLALIWAALDLVELIIQLRFVEDPKLSERVVIAFASRATGILVLLWANIVSVADGVSLDFRSASPQAGLYLLLAAGLRVGVLPLHLPYAGESVLRRGVGTALRAITAASSLILLARIPTGSIAPQYAPYLLMFTAFAAVYGGWMWLRAPDELTGRPYWLIGIGSLAVAAALRENPAGAAAWGCALILCGGVLFLSSEPNQWLVRGLWIAAFGMSALPFSLTATGWNSGGGSFFLAWLPLIAAHAMLLAGFIRHIVRPPAPRVRFEEQPIWAKNIYPIGIFLLLLTILLLGLFGWDASLQFGNLFASGIASLLTFGLVWFTPRLRVLNPVRAHWVRPTNPTWFDWGYQALWNLYQQTGRLSNVFAKILEGESGIMWTLLFLALFISFFARGNP
ncbi:MAG: hypothetical protein MHPDNHAH_01734 [Anaerolineales bacterium]|nr:hypothetical protein [Anaerolineales bacterium]WKZ49251.1 MAG: hypothetical protein QY306_07760 [Anaerolineales bacterium]